jgi:hypothetical protein
MPKRLPVPRELQHLLEKREEADRRAAARRGKDVPAAEAAVKTPAERRSGKDRRKKARRQDER